MDVTPDQPAYHANAAMAAELRAARAILHITQQAVSDLSGVPMRTLTRLFAGDRDIDMKQLLQIAPALQVSATELLARAEKRAADLAAVSGASEDALKAQYSTAANQSSEDDPTDDDEAGA